VSAVRTLAVLGALALVLGGRSVRADDNRPLYIQLTETAPQQFVVAWKVPANIEPRHLPDLRPPADCRSAPRVRQWSEPLGHWREARWTCPRGLSGRTVTIAYPHANPNLATIARLKPLQGGPQTLVLMPQQTGLTLSAAGEQSVGFVRYLALGFEHIWRGFDHLLFVAGLIFVAGSVRRILVTISGFTLAHSLTLALATLDLVRITPAAVETVIALSIVFLAVEIVKGPRDSLTWRRPVAVASSFGLLHGFGFAAALREVGLPDGGLVAALLGFNIGIEAGQIVFAAVLCGSVATLGRWLRQGALAARIQRIAGYGIGSLAGYWAIARFVG
jgi:hypothetical protein